MFIHCVRARTRQLVLLGVWAIGLLAGTARADLNIVIDGSFSDWTGAQCLTMAGGGTQNLSNVCITNNNTSGSNGKLFGYGTGTGDWNQAFAFGFYVDVDGDGAMTDSDEYYSIHFAKSASTPDSMT